MPALPTIHESNEAKKAMAYDLLKIFRSVENPDEKQYSAEDVMKIIDHYIEAATGNS